MKWIEKIQRVFMAASFGEAGEWDTAREILKQGERESKKKRVGKRNAIRRRPRARIFK